MKYILSLFGILLFFSSFAQIELKEKDEVDRLFDSLYAVGLQKYNAKKDSIKLHELYADIDYKIAYQPDTEELVITNSSIRQFPDEIVKLKNLKRVSFDMCKNINAEKIIAQLTELSGLKELAFNNCKLFSLPQNINTLTNLEHLSIKGNKIVRLPEELKNLKNLKEINVSKNPILNEEFFFALLSGMPQVKSVKASYCNIRTLANNIQVDNLDLEGNLLIEIPNDLKTESLNLSANPFLDTESLFTSLANVRNLKNLDLSYNKWEVLPLGIKQLNQLERLNLRGNYLKSLPDEIGALTSLRVLQVDNKDKYVYTNQLSSLPSSFSKLTALDSLFLAGNKIEKLPADFKKLTNLSYLDLSWNKLSAFPKDITALTNLQHLDLAMNHVVTIPEEIGNLTALRKLNLQGDFFVNYQLKIKTLPNSIGELKKLTHLIISDNVIEELPNSLGKCTQLKVIDADDNLLSTLPNTIGQLSQLKELHLKANELKTLPSEFKNLANLETLDLSFNFNIASDSAASLIAPLKSLKKLNVTDSYFTKTAVALLHKELPEVNIITTKD